MYLLNMNITFLPNQPNPLNKYKCQEPNPMIACLLNASSF